jgi:hypothetical protein
MEEFPRIVFRSGPTGRRAGIVGGPDVWEIVRDLKGVIAEGTASDPIGTVASVSGLDHGVVELAASYYAAYPDNVDERISMNEQAAERLHSVPGNARSLPFTAFGCSGHGTTARDMEQLLEHEWNDDARHITVVKPRHCEAFEQLP